MTFAGVPNSFVNGTTADAPSVNADFDAVTTGLNNIDAGQVTTGTLPIGRGGTGAVTAAVALTNLLSGSSVPLANGGTGSTTAVGAFNAIVQSAESIGATGYLKLQNGLILAWGAAAFNSATATTVTLPLTVAQIVSVQVTLTLGAGVALNAGVSTLSTTSFQINLSASATLSAYWFVVAV